MYSAQCRNEQHSFIATLSALSTALSFKRSDYTRSTSKSWTFFRQKHASWQ